MCIWKMYTLKCDYEKCIENTSKTLHHHSYFILNEKFYKTKTKKLNENTKI